MSVTVHERADRTTGASTRAIGAAVIAGGCLLLVARPPLLEMAPNPVLTITILFAGLLAVGVLWPDATVARPTASRWGAATAGALALGLAAFALGRVIGGGEAPLHLSIPTTDLLRVIALNSLAAVAEEAFFRRFVYGVLSGRGPGVAIAGSAALFAIVHVTVYGWWVLPLDLAAGFVLSWQRWATGSWRVPAITHVIANVLVVI